MFKISLLHSSKYSRSRRMITIRTISFLREATPRPSLLHSKCSSRTLICSSPPFDHSSRTPLSLLYSKCRSKMMISIPKRRISFLKRRMNLNPSLLRSRKKVSLLCNKRNSNKLISDHSLPNNSNRLTPDRNLLNNSRTIFSSRTASSPKCSSRAVKISRIHSQCSRSKTIFSNKTNSFNLRNRMTFSHKMISCLQCSSSSRSSPFNNRTINTSRICSRRSSSNHNSSSRTAVRRSLSTCSRKIFPSSSNNNNLSRRNSRTVSVWINLPNSSNSNNLTLWNRIIISPQFRRFLSRLNLQLNSNNPTLTQLFRNLHVHRRHVVFPRETTNSTQNYTTMIGMTTRMTDARDGNQNTE
mmetsp:Transcript_33102/g.56372  ORF Transcript_33102/g.56372 Transcript_33102/m.56372 type:complete len:355 (-) Transcript_33102:205-1269(-)